MVLKRYTAITVAAVVVFGLLSGSTVGAATIESVQVFAEGSAVKATGPDSIAVADDSIWVSYTNGADSTGLTGSSTVVQYSLSGRVRQTFEIAGSVDGLKVDPRTGLVWALQNQDGNSTLTLIDEDEDIAFTSNPIPYAVKSATRGYDDVVFRNHRIFLSYTNPVNPADVTIQMLVKGTNPLAVKPILTMGATGTDLATGKHNQPTSQSDPDSLKLTPWGDLQLTSGADGQLIFVAHPGTDEQAVSFLSLLDPSGNPVSGLDDAVFATAERGVFYLADTSNNRVLAIKVADVESGSLFASVGSLNELVSVNLKTGKVSAFVKSADNLPLSGPHGLVFQPQHEGEDEGRR
jgi:hypothetical protein